MKTQAIDDLPAELAISRLADTCRASLDGLVPADELDEIAGKCATAAYWGARYTAIDTPSEHKEIRTYFNDQKKRAQRALQLLDELDGICAEIGYHIEQEFETKKINTVEWLAGNAAAYRALQSIASDDTFDRPAHRPPTQAARFALWMGKVLVYVMQVNRAASARLIAHLIPMVGLATTKDPEKSAKSIEQRLRNAGLKRRKN